ncbi:hypothetical protein BH11PSE11_BH11PSE11_39270 [soil metagenome]
MSNIRSFAALAGLTAILLLQACSKTEEAKAPAAAPAAPAASAPAAPAGAALSLTDKLTAYHAASPADRKAVIPLALAKVKDEIDKKGKSDSDIADEILPCMNSVDEQVAAADRATQPIMDLAAVCLAQLGYKK